MNPTSPQTYAILKFILTKKEFTQLGIHKNENISLGQVNAVIKWVCSRNFIEKAGRKYRVIDPAGIVSLFPLFRNMDDLLSSKLQLRVDKNAIIKNLPKNCVLCLDTALEKYSSYFRTDRMCVYGDEKLVNLLQPYTGGGTQINIYRPDLNLKKDIETREGRLVTSKLRTLIDIACDGKMYLGKDLFKDLWGLEID